MPSVKRYHHRPLFRGIGLGAKEPTEYAICAMPSLPLFFSQISTWNPQYRHAARARAVADRRLVKHWTPLKLRSDFTESLTVTRRRHFTNATNRIPQNRCSRKSKSQSCRTALPCHREECRSRQRSFDLRHEVIYQHCSRHSKNAKMHLSTEVFDRAAEHVAELHHELLTPTKLHHSRISEKLGNY